MIISCLRLHMKLKQTLFELDAVSVARKVCVCVSVCVCGCVCVWVCVCMGGWVLCGGGVSEHFVLSKRTVNIT